MSNWQYQQSGNPFGQAMMNAGLPEYSKGPRQAFYGGDASVKAAGFPLDHPMSYTSPVTGKHQAWVPDEGVEQLDNNASDGVFGDFVKHPNLEKVYPDAMNVPVHKKQMTMKGGLGFNKEIYLNDKLHDEEQGPIAMHEMQHWINKATGNNAPTEKAGVWDKLFGGNKAYWNSEEETTARATEKSVTQLLDSGVRHGEQGLQQLRNDMTERTGSSRFYKEK